MDLSQVKIYRMLHIDNIPYILEKGIVHRSSKNADPNFISIGDSQLIDNRNTKKVSIDNGTKTATLETIVLGDFIPFYFGIKMPMLYVIQQGGNFVEKPVQAKDIVYTVCSVSAIIHSSLEYYFSDGHATDFLSSFFNKKEIDRLTQIIDWNAIKAPYWGGHENLIIKRKKQAEFLVKGDIPTDYIVGYGCYNEDAKEKLIRQGVEGSLIKVIPRAYY